MKKIIFFDIDGTIISEDENSFIPESTVKAIRLAKENNCYVYINTGRTLCSIDQRVKDIGFDGYICGCGTYISHQGKNIFYNQTSDEICRFIENTIIKSNAIPVYEGKDALYYDRKFENDKILISFRSTFLKNNVPFFSTEENPDFKFDKFVLWLENDKHKDFLISEISRYYTVIDRGGGLLENVPVGFSKATGIKKILDILDIDINNAYVIGDSMNDLSMFQAVPNSIAMGQGKAIHKYASYITDDIYNDGIWNALRHFNLIID